MDARDWYREKRDAQAEYDTERIMHEVYEKRTKFTIGMIYKCGDTSDEEAAKRMAKAHGYDIDELVKMVM